MPACKPHALIQSGKVRRALLRHKIFRGRIARIAQAAAHDLLYLSVVYIYTGSKFHTITSIIPFFL
jgi:hypothetical protein